MAGTLDKSTPGSDSEKGASVAILAEKPVPEVKTTPVKGQPYPSMADLDRWCADDRVWVLLYLDDADGNTPKGACIEHRSGFPLFTTAFGPAYAKYAEETIGWICDNTASGTAHGPLPQDDPLRSIFLSLPGLTYELDRGTIKYRRA